MLFDVKNQKWRALKVATNNFGYMTWSPDSASVYFDTLQTGASAFFRLRISDSKLEKLCDLNKVARYADPFGGGSTWTGLGPGEVLPASPRHQHAGNLFLRLAASVRLELFSSRRTRKGNPLSPFRVASCNLPDSVANARTWARFATERSFRGQLSKSDGMRRPVSGRDAEYTPKLSTCSRHR